MNNKEQTETFMNILYHGLNENSRICLSVKTQSEERPWLDKMHSLSDRCNMVEGLDTYTSLSAFKGESRTTGNCVARMGCYVDLDCHDNVMDFKANEIVEKIETAITDGKLKRPTMIVDTGRGLGIFYVLVQPVFIGNNTEKMVKKYEMTYNALLDDYKKIFDGTNIEVDTSVKDAARVCRIPGTYNTKAGRYAELIYINEKDGEVQYCDNFKDMAEIGNVERKNNHNKKDKLRSYDGVGEKYLMEHRMACIEKLAVVRSKCGDNVRQNMAFAYYNCAVQIMTKAKAEKKLWELNEKFAKPLPKSEIRHIINELSKTQAYRYRTSQLMNLMAMSQEEANQVGLEESLRRKERAEIKARHERERNDLYEKIRDVVINTNIKITDIAIMFGVSRTTVNNVIKMYGANRNKTKYKNKNSLSLEKVEMSIYEKNKILADDVLNKLEKAYPSENHSIIALILNIYNTMTSNVNEYTILLINSMAMIGDAVDTSIYGWERRLLNDVDRVITAVINNAIWCNSVYNLPKVPVLDKLKGEKVIESFAVGNKNNIKPSQIMNYECKTKNIEIKEPNFPEVAPPKHVSNGAKEIYRSPKTHEAYVDTTALSFTEVVERSNGLLMMDYMRKEMNENVFYINIWEYWEHNSNDEQLRQIRILKTKILNTKFESVEDFISYAMSCCTTYDMNVNIERICKFFKCNCIEDIKLKEKKEPSEKQKAAYEKNRIRCKEHNKLWNYLYENYNSSAACNIIRKLYFACNDNVKVKKYIIIGGIICNPSEIKKMIWTSNVDFVQNLEAYNEKITHLTRDDAFKFIIDEFIANSDKTKNWEHRINIQLPAIA